MFKVTKQMWTETAHRLAGHPGRCNYLHGHSYRWEVTVESCRLDDGMVLDFSNLKVIMNDVIDPFDHALVLEDSAMSREIVVMLKRYNLIERVMIVPYRPTAEQMAQEVAVEIKKRLQVVLPELFEGTGARVIVKLWETATSYAEASW